MLLYIVYNILFVNTVNTKIKARNALNAMFVKTVDTLVFVALTQHLIQSTMRCETPVLTVLTQHSIQCIACFDLCINSVHKQDTILNTQ